MSEIADQEAFNYLKDAIDALTEIEVKLSEISVSIPSIEVALEVAEEDQVNRDLLEDGVGVIGMTREKLQENLEKIENRNNEEPE